MDNTFVAEGTYRHFGVIFSSIDWRRCSEYKGIICNQEGGVCYYLYLSWRSLFVTYASCIFLQLHSVLEPLCIHNSAAAEYMSATRNTCLFWVCIDPIHVFHRLLPGGQSLSIIFIQDHIKEVVNWQDGHIYLHKLRHTFGIVFDIGNVSCTACIYISRFQVVPTLANVVDYQTSNIS